MELYTAFFIGLAGSFHCIGMCGPIVIALPFANNGALNIIFSRLIYNFGRVISYMIIGALFGMIGNRLYLAGLQQGTTIVLGIVIIIALLLPQKLKNKANNLPPVNILTNYIKIKFKKFSENPTFFSMFIIGILNGFLPCGFVYMGAFGSLTTSGFTEGIIYMALFGLGTIPIMFATSMIGGVLNLNLRRRISKLIPVLAFFLAVIFILRGLELGIPFISPKLQKMAIKKPVVKEKIIEAEKKHDCCSGNM